MCNLLFRTQIPSTKIQKIDEYRKDILWLDIWATNHQAQDAVKLDAKEHCISILRIPIIHRQKPMLAPGPASLLRKVGYVFPMGIVSILPGKTHSTLSILQCILTLQIKVKLNKVHHYTSPQTDGYQPPQLLPMSTRKQIHLAKWISYSKIAKSKRRRVHHNKSLEDPKKIKILKLDPFEHTTLSSQEFTIKKYLN